MFSLVLIIIVLYNRTTCTFVNIFININYNCIIQQNDLWKDSRLKQLENIYKKQDYAETELQSRKKNQQTNQRQDSRKSTNQQLDGRRSSNQYQDGRRSSNQQQDIRRSSNQHVDRHKQANQQVDIRSYAARSQQQEKVTPNKTAQQRVTGLFILCFFFFGLS